MVLLATGPPQPCIDVEEESVPSLLRMTKVPQKANEVLVEPVLLLMVNCKVRCIESPVVQLLQTPVPGKAAPTSMRSLEVQEVAGGNVVVVCEMPFKKNSKAGNKRSNVFLISVRVLKELLIAEVFKVFKRLLRLSLIVDKK